jgi:hypothetical protein
MVVCQGRCVWRTSARTRMLGTAPTTPTSSIDDEETWIYELLTMFETSEAPNEGFEQISTTSRTLAGVAVYLSSCFKSVYVWTSSAWANFSKLSKEMFLARRSTCATNVR